MGEYFTDGRVLQTRPRFHARLARIFQAKLKEAQYKEMIGSLIPRDEVKQASFETARMLRDKLMALPAQLSPYVSQEDMPIVTKMIHEFIKDLQETANAIALK